MIEFINTVSEPLKIWYVFTCCLSIGLLIVSTIQLVVESNQDERVKALVVVICLGSCLGVIAHVMTKAPPIALGGGGS